MQLSQSKQVEIVKYINETFEEYSRLSADWRDRMVKIKKWVSSFEQLREQTRETGFKINKMHEIENRILPRIMAKNPHPIVTYKDTTEQEYDVAELSTAVQDKLYATFKKKDMIESLRLVAKNWIRYWLWFAKVCPRYKTTIDAEDSYKEDVYDEYAGIQVKNRTEIFFDPRYMRLEDMPCLIDVTKNVRLSYFTKNPSKYINLDKLTQCCATANQNRESYSRVVENITGIPPSKPTTPTTIDVKCYYWLYDLSDSKTFKNEKLYEFRVVDNIILVYAKEITCIPYEEFKVFEDTESFYATWFLEPILWLQNEYNWKKNKTSEYINRLLKPDWIRSPQSGTDPRKLNQWHWNIISTSRGWQEALLNLVQLPMKEVSSSYFQEQWDLERQFQTLSFTVNTSTPITQNSLTNTATGAKIQANDTDAVMLETQKHFEEFIVRITYKMLQVEYEMMDENKKVKTEDWYWEMNKEALKNATKKYEIDIQAWSSSYNSEENKRNDALALRNLWEKAKQLGVPVNANKLFEMIISSFPNMDKNKIIQQEIPWMEQAPQMPQPTQPLPQTPQL